MKINDRRKLKIIVNLTYCVIIAMIIYLGLKYALPALFPFILALIPAAAAQKPSRVLSGRFKRMPDKLIRAAVITVIWLVPVGLLCVVLSRVAREVGEFASELPDILERTAEALLGAESRRGWLTERLPEWMTAPLEGAVARLREDSAGVIMSVIERLTDSENGLLAVGSAAMRLPAFALTLVIAVASSYFIGLDMDGIKSALRSLLPERAAKKLYHAKSCAAETLTTLVRAYALLMLLTFAELAAGFAILNFFGAGIEHILPLSVLIALVDILPVIGTGTVMLPWAAVELISGDGAKSAMLAGLYAVIAVVRNFLEPKLVGQSLGIHPALMLAAIYAGGRLFGAAGIFLLPAVTIVLVSIRRYDETQKAADA